MRSRDYVRLFEVVAERKATAGDLSAEQLQDLLPFARERRLDRSSRL